MTVNDWDMKRNPYQEAIYQRQVARDHLIRAAAALTEDIDEPRADATAYALIQIGLASLAVAKSDPEEVALERAVNAIQASITSREQTVSANPGTRT